MLFLHFFLLLTGVIFAADYCLHRDLVHALTKNLEPHLHGVFQRLQQICENSPTSKNDIIPLWAHLMQNTRNATARSLLQLIPSLADQIVFGDMAALGYGDKYRLILTLAQSRVPGFDLDTCFNYQIEQWRRMDMLGKNLKLSQNGKLHKHTKPLKILEDVLLSMRFDLERRIKKFNAPQNFLRGMEMATAGVLVALPVSKNLDFASLGTELVLLLDPKLVEHIIRSPVPIRLATEQVFPLIKPAIRGLYFKQAYTFWKHFVTANNALTHHGMQYSLFGKVAKEKQTDVVSLFRERMHHVRRLMPKIFELDHRLTPYFMLASWNLVQFFKYASRLVPVPFLRIELEEFVLEYGTTVNRFIFGVSSRIPLTQKLNVPPGLCRFPNGPYLQDIIIVSSPLPSGGEPFYHYSLTQYNPNHSLTLLNTSNLAKTPWANMLVVLSEPAFQNPAICERFMAEIVEKFCSLQKTNLV